MDQLFGMGVSDPFCLFWGGVSFRGASSWILKGICHTWHLGLFHSGPKTHLCGCVFNSVSQGETRLPVVIGMGVGVNSGGCGGWKSGEEEARESSSSVEATGVKTFAGHPGAHGGVLVRREFKSRQAP